MAGIEEPRNVERAPLTAVEAMGSRPVTQAHPRAKEP